MDTPRPLMCAALTVSVLALMTLAPGTGLAAAIVFNHQANWLAAIGGQTNATVFHFDGPTELDGRLANDPLIDPSYDSQGVSFLPFLGTEVYPYIARSQGHQIPDPTRDGLLANSNSPNPLSDLIGRAIRFDFTIPTNAVGVFTNRWPLDNPRGDGGYLLALDALLDSIGQVDLDAGIFGGLITDEPISRVLIVNTWDADISFGIWDLQFANGMVTDVEAGAFGGHVALLAPVPNPVTDGVTVRWTLPMGGVARVKVLDLAGREICVLYAGHCAPGVTQTRWDGRDSRGRSCVPGIYFVRLETDAVASDATGGRGALSQRGVLLR
jgi:hypothetical protein